MRSLPLGVLLQTVYGEVPSLLSLMDNLEKSESFGCFYPAFWKYKSRDFANVRAQEAVLTLSLLFAQCYEDNRYLGDARLLRHIRAGMEYWTRLQHRDGSFDEWRKLEHGQAGTAFSTFALANAYQMTKDSLGEPLRGKLLTCFRKSADFLCKNPDLDFMNHEAVAIAALHSCYSALGNELYLEKIKEKIGIMEENQSYEGWYKEGYGADSGYNTVSMSYLGFYYRQSGDESVLPMLKRAVRFNSYLVYPDGLSGGGFNSRGTGMLFSLGFVILSEKMEIARRLAYVTLRSLIEGRMNGLYTLNDMRKCIMLYLLLWTLSEAERSELATRERLPSEREGATTRYMRESGIVLVKTPLYHLVIGGRKGCIGAIYSYDARLTVQMSSPEYYDCPSGIYGKTSEGFILSNMGFVPSGANELFARKCVSTVLDLSLIDPKLEEVWKVGGRLIDRPPLVSLYHLACELDLRDKVYAMFDKYKVFSQNRMNKPVVRLTRRIGWEDSEVRLQNEIDFLRPIRYDELYLGETFVLHGNGRTDVRKSGDHVEYVCDGRRVMIMRAKANEIDVRLGEADHLRFNNVQPVLALVPLDARAGTLRVDYTLEMLGGEK